MTSKWGRETLVEVLSDSDDSYQTPPLVGSLQWGQHQGDRLPREDGEILLFKRSNLLLSSLQSQPRGPPSGGPTQTLKWRGHWTKGKFIKVSWTCSSRSLEEPGSIVLSTRRVRSPSPLEYTSDVPKEEREGSPGYSKWVPSDYFGKMLGWLADVDLGKSPSYEEDAQGQFGIGWVDKVLQAEAEAWQDFKDEEIKGLVDTHNSPVPRCG